MSFYQSCTQNTPDQSLTPPTKWWTVLGHEVKRKLREIFLWSGQCYTAFKGSGHYW